MNFVFEVRHNSLDMTIVTIPHHGRSVRPKNELPLLSCQNRTGKQRGRTIGKECLGCRKICIFIYGGFWLFFACSKIRNTIELYSKNTYFFDDL